MSNNPFLNPKHPFYGSETPEMAYKRHLDAEKRKALEERINGRTKNKKETITKNVDTNIIAPEDVSLDKIVFEPSKVDEWQYFNDSLSGLKSRGWKRHARPVEVMTVLVNYLKKGDASNYAGLAKNMLSGKGEWISAAFKKKDNILEVALDPENLVWNSKNNVYVVNGGNLVSGVVTPFDIGNKSSGSWIDLGEFPDSLVQYLYGKNFKDLPKEMQEGSKKAQLYFRENIWWPVGRGGGIISYDLYAYYGDRASRGVRQ